MRSHQLSETHQPACLDGGTLLAICVATYKRDFRLGLLLESIRNLDSIEQFNLELIVVDNWGKGSAKEVCEAFESTTGISTRYAFEARQGVSFARNRALLELGELVKFVAFLDDDEVVHPRWLVEMASATHAFPAEVWNGPVLPTFAPDTPEWIIAGKFFERPSRSDGSIRDRANTGNVLFKRRVLSEITPWFSEGLAHSGGEDTDFFHRLHQAGFKIVWVCRAVVSEEVCPERASARAIFKRGLDSSMTTSGLRLLHDSSARAMIRVVAGAFGRLLQGLVLLPIALVRIDRREFQVAAMLRFAWAIGAVSALLGKRSTAYMSAEENSPTQ